VTCPIELFPATSQSDKTHFHQINTRTGHRLRQQMVDEETGRRVDSEHKGRGYELSKGKYVEIDEDELIVGRPVYQAIRPRHRHACGYRLANDGVRYSRAPGLPWLPQHSEHHAYTALAPGRFKGFFRD
jgi:hypothetical protein